MNLDENEDVFGVVLSDVLIQMLVIIMFLFTMEVLLPHFEASKAEKTKMGQLCVELSWPNDRNIDLDLWGHSPGDKNVVGYTNMHGDNLNLYRDVVGFSRNPTHQMLEIMCADQLVPGEWTFNVHYFSNHEDGLVGLSDKSDPRYAVEATMMVSIKPEHGTASPREFFGKWKLTHESEEKTMFDFVLDKNGNIIENSINSNFVPLKAGWKKAE